MKHKIKKSNYPNSMHRSEAHCYKLKFYKILSIISTEFLSERVNI